MGKTKLTNGMNKKKKFLGIIFSFVFLTLSSLVAFKTPKGNSSVAKAADYSGVSSGFTHGSDGSISATFTVTNNNLDMKGWLLCLFSSKPTVSNNKLVDSNDAHPKSYSNCKHYFFVGNTSKTGTITITWAANANDQKQNWTASASTGASGKTLKDYVGDGTNWHLVIGPRHYNTSWGDSGIGAGTNGYWENCDYYVGALNEVFPEQDQDMSVSVTSYNNVYDGQSHSISINVSKPTSGYTIKYRTSSSGSYNLPDKPSYTDVGTNTIYFQVTASGYNAYSGSGTVTISKANPTYTKPTAKTGLVYDGTNQVLLNAGSSNVKYSLDNSTYSTSVPTGNNAGTYTVYYKVDATNNYNGVSASTIQVSIAKADAIYTAPSIKTNLIYNGNDQPLITAGSDNVTYSLDGVNYSSVIPTGKNAGTYTLYYKVDETTNYKGVSATTIQVSIAKADAIYTAPSIKTNLIYNGNNQALITAGSDNVIYSLDGVNYSSDIPTGKNAGTYTVYFKVDATTNYKSVDVDTLEVEIAKKDATFLVTPVAKLGLNYTAESRALIEAGSSDGGTVLYSLDGISYSEDIPEKTLVGAYNVSYKIEGDSNYNGSEPQTIEVRIYPNDKTALNSVIDLVNIYLKDISLDYPYISYLLNEELNSALVVSDDDNQTIAQIEEAKNNLIHAFNLAHAQVVDTLIDNIGEVRYTDKCEIDIEKAETAYSELGEEQQSLVSKLDRLSSARSLYDRLEEVAQAIANIGEVTYDDECLERIEEAREAFDSLSKDEQNLIPTFANDLVSAEDVYEALKLISNLGLVQYTPAYKMSLLAARNAFNALSYHEQELIYNYEELLNAEEMYDHIDEVVNLVNEISSELEYVGTHNSEIDKARHAYDLLTEEEKLLVPELTYLALTSAEETYEELKVEHERKEIEDRESGVVIATEGGSGIPNTVSIDISSGNSTNEEIIDDIDYQTIVENLNEDETISYICEITLYEEVDGEIVEVSLQDIDEDMYVVIKIDVPEDIDESNFKVVLLDEDNNIIEMEYSYDPLTKQASVRTNRLGTFAIITPNETPHVNRNYLWLAILACVVVTVVITTATIAELKRKKEQ